VIVQNGAEPHQTTFAWFDSLPSKQPTLLSLAARHNIWWSKHNGFKHRRLSSAIDKRI